MITTLVIISGLLQALGYLIYIRKSLAHELEPNATTWMMFSYGTAMLVVLEWDREASLNLLVLPIVCAALSLGVAYLCYQRGTLTWRVNRLSKVSFLVDVLLSLGYVGMWFAGEHQMVPEAIRTEFVLALLLVSNASTVVQFVPLMDGAYRDPDVEHPLPWVVWATAYATLGVLTYLEVGKLDELMVYPVLNTVLHGTVAFLATRRPRASALNTRC